MKISLITVVYNSRETIKDAIDSVCTQDYGNIEYIIVDGASSDGTVDVITEAIKIYTERKIKFISESDNGIYDALNKGISQCDGDIIGILNSDDVYASKKVISEVVSIMQAMKTDAIYGDLVYVKPKNLEHIVRFYKSSDFSPQKISQGIMPAHPTLFLRRNVYEQYGFFKTEYQIAADFEFVARIFKDSKLSYHYLPKVMVKMRTGGVSTKNLKSNWILNREILRACKENNIETNILKILSKYPRKMLGLIASRKNINFNRIN